MNKKAGLDDVIFFMIALFVVGIVAIVGWKLMSVINTDFQNNNQISAQGKQIMSDFYSKNVNLVDNSFVIIFTGLLMAILIGAFFIKSHPALFWISIPIMAFIIFLSAIYSNFFYAFSQTPDFSEQAADFTIITFVLNHYVFVITIVILLMAVALYAKNNLFPQQ